MSIPHGGNREEASRRFGIPAGNFLDFSASVSPLGVSEKVRKAITDACDRLDQYPDPACTALTEALARRHQRHVNEILATSGATEALSLAFRALKPRKVGVLAPCYRDIERAAAQAGTSLDFFHAREARAFAPDWDAFARWVSGHDLIALGSPNNPTGRPIPPEVMIHLAETHPDAVFLLDEAFIDFMDLPEAWSLSRGGAALDNVLILRSLTKFHAIPGLRLGYALGARERIAALGACGDPWSVSVPAQAAGLACLDDAEYGRSLRAVVLEGRKVLSEGLQRLGFTVYPSQTNFLLARVPAPITAASLGETLGRRGILVRDASDFPGLGPSFLRVAVRTAEENARLLAELARKSHASA